MSPGTGQAEALSGTASIDGAVHAPALDDAFNAQINAAESSQTDAQHDNKLQERPKSNSDLGQPQDRQQLRAARRVPATSP
jgi:hypothetical protein